MRLTRLELYRDGSGAHVVPKIAAADLKAIFAAIRNGFTAMRADMEAQISDQVRIARDQLELTFEARLVRAVEAELERLTAPGTVA